MCYVRLKQWRTDFPSIFFVFLTAMVYHVPQFMKLYGSIHQFNCQTVELKNHIQSRAFHRATQKGGKNSKYTEQVQYCATDKLLLKYFEIDDFTTFYKYEKTTDESKHCLYICLWWWFLKFKSSHCHSEVPFTWGVFIWVNNGNEEKSIRIRLLHLVAIREVAIEKNWSR